MILHFYTVQPCLLDFDFPLHEADFISDRERALTASVLRHSLYVFAANIVSAVDHILDIGLIAV